ncbi:hypothetical protein [Glutamicibacter soli]|uniref:hypothetical protein n=1 Tax=Glutamicibacter soli TaxID=453836 RepID=UPI003FD4F2C3
MKSQNEALESLSRSRLNDLLVWGATVAFAHTNELFEDDAGHDQGVVGYLNFKHLCDLLDRATANGRFTLGDDVEGAGTDVLERGVTPEAFRTMPVFAPNSVSRSNYKGSPGWASDGIRVLLQSFAFGKVDDIKWAQRSNAKREVASQKVLVDATLFNAEDYGMEAVVETPNDFDGVTLVAAHAYDPLTGQYELYIGQSKNPQYRGDSCWHWHVKLLSGGTANSEALVDSTSSLPGAAATSEVDDIDVRIKMPFKSENTGTANV